MTVAECCTCLRTASLTALPDVVGALRGDSRRGVQDAVAAAERRLAAHAAEVARVAALFETERALRARGYEFVAGIDEVGRGALAGPLTVAAVVLPHETALTGLDDSKRLSPEQRARLDRVIRTQAIAVCLVHVPAARIDAVGMTAALREGCRGALADLDPRADHALVDGLGVGGLGVPETPIVGGDGRCAAIAAASIVAKVARDALMCELAESYPPYAFRANKGYGTAEHLRAIARHGASAVHRRSFSPCVDAPTLF